MGLGSYWGEVLDVLQDIIPIYDKVNSYISLGKDSEHRNKAIKGRIKKGDFVLDAGSGFGNMSKTAIDVTNGDIRVMLYDPLVPMLKNTDRLFFSNIIWGFRYRFISIFTYRRRLLHITKSGI